MFYDVKLIKLVKLHPILFDKKHPHHNNKNEKDKTWKFIADMLHIPVEEVTKRWTTLRRQFVTQYNENKLSQADPRSKARTSSWRLYQPLIFLENHVSSRRPTGNVNETWPQPPPHLPLPQEVDPAEYVALEYDDEFEEEPSLEQHSGAADSGIPTGLPALEAAVNEAATALKVSLNHGGNPPVSNDDPEMAFGQSIGRHLKWIRSRPERIDLQGEIFKMIWTAIAKQEN